MYKTPDYDYEQLSFISFNSTCGMQLDPDNEWIKISRLLPWKAWEPLYSVLFPSDIITTAGTDRHSVGWGRLKSGIGWISLDFVKRV